MVDNTAQLPAARGQRLKRLRMLANLERRDLEKHYQVNYESLKGWETARHGGLTEKAAKKLIPIFKEHGVLCSLEWLLNDLGPGPQIAFTRKIQKNDPLTQDKQNIVEELAFFQLRNPNSLTMCVGDNKMEPCFKQGDQIAGVIAKEDMLAKIVNLDCIIITNTNEKLLRRVKSVESHFCQSIMFNVAK